MNIAIFVSGSGSNCENIIRHFQGSELVNTALVVSNRADAYALTRAKNLNVPAIVVSKADLNREDYLLSLLEQYHIDFIVLAGFLLMAPSFLINRYPRRIINLHPALLPKFGGKGMWGHHVHEAVKAAGETVTGMTVHYVSEVCDGGEIIAQFRTPITPDDTPDDIAVRAVRFAAPDFSARFNAVRREYRYRIVNAATPPIFLRDFAWWLRAPLDVEAMRLAAQLLVGEHDFRSFCKAKSAEGKTTMRCVEALELFEEEQLGEKCLCIRVVGNAFLHSMVRTIVGTLVQVGAGHRSPEWVGQVLEARDRSAAGETAPAQGLVFWEVVYPHGILREEL